VRQVLSQGGRLDPDAELPCRIEGGQKASGLGGASRSWNDIEFCFRPRTLYFLSGKKALPPTKLSLNF
jgi:hypothetical protein